VIPIPRSAPVDVQQAFRAVADFADRWEGPRNIDLKGRRIINAGQAADGQDYVTRFELEEALADVEAHAPDTLSPAASGQPPTILYGLHDDRTALAIQRLAEGTLFYETDRAAIYQLQDDGTGVIEWWLVMCRPLRTADAKPGDLGNNDAGFTWFDQVEGIYWRWSGGVWNYYIGSYVNTYANMPAAAEADRGFLFIASDYGEHVWRKGASAFELIEGMGGPMYGTAAERATVAAALGANDTGFRFVTTDQGWQTWRWVGSGLVFALLPGSGEPMRGTLSPDQKPTLGVNDAGFLFYSTDFDRTYRWTGTAWADAPDQPKRGTIAYFPVTIHADFAPGTGWQLCDGTAGVTRSTPTGGTTTFTAPDLTTANRFLRSVSGATGGTGGSATTHTHPVNPPSTASGAPSATVAVQSGTGTTVATDTHAHSTDIASFDSGTPSGTSGDDALPPYYNARPYIRL
jgi:hypothetical protein